MRNEMAVEVRLLAVLKDRKLPVLHQVVELLPRTGYFVRTAWL